MARLTVPTHRRPTTPGEMLVEEFLRPLGVSQTAFSVHIGVTFARLNEIVNGKRHVTPDTALRFSRALGTSPEFWLNAQHVLDLYDAARSKKGEAIRRIRPLPAIARNKRTA